MFGATPTAIVAGRFPLELAVIATQFASLAAVHEQPVSVSSVTLNAPPAAETAVLVGETVKRHGAGSWTIASCVLLTLMAARRCEGSPFVATRYSIDPLPCPLVEEPRVTHDAFDAAVHVQSRVVVTVTVLVSPDEGTEPVIALAAVTSHLTAVGAVTSIEFDPEPQPTARRLSAHATNSRARIARSTTASRLPRPFQLFCLA